MKLIIYIKRFLSILLGTTIVFIIVIFCQDNFFFFNDNNSWIIKNFYKEEKNTIDVIVIGSSEVIAGYFPGLAYKDKKITSYPIAVDASSISLWKYQIEEVLKTQTPKIFLIEISGALYDNDEKIFDDAALRRYSDNTPLSCNKINMLSNMKLKDSLLSYYFPGIKYHSDLKNSQNAFTEKCYFDSIEASKLKGVITCTSVDKTPIISYDSSAKSRLNITSENYLNDFFDYCKQKGIEKSVVFIRFPHKITSKNDAELIYKKNTVKHLVTTNGFDFIDMANDAKKYNLDYQKDFYNINHLNVYGAEKATSYLIDFLCSKYNIHGRTQDKWTNINWNSAADFSEHFIVLAKDKISSGEEMWLSEGTELLKVMK